MTSTSTSEAPGAKRVALIVAGMHRSGTSAMARVLSLAGGDMPDRLIGAAADNPLGFWEPRDVVALNDEILHVVGSRWNDVFGFKAAGLEAGVVDAFLPRARSVLALNYADAALAVVKDPRVSVLVPLWRAAMEAEDLEPAFVIMVRDPLEVAQSIAARDGAPLQASMLAWLSHMVSVERDTRDAPRVFVSYTALIDDWQGVLGKVQRQLSLTLPQAADQGGEIAGFLSRSARHHTTDDASWIGRTDIWPGVAEAWRWLKAAADATGPTEAFPDEIANDLARLETQLGPVLQDQNARAALRERDLQAVIADREIKALRLQARVGEHQIVGAELSGALAAARQEAADVRSELTAAKAAVSRLEDSEAALRAEGERAAEQAEADLRLARRDAEEIQAGLTDALESARAELEAAQLRVASLERAAETFVADAIEQRRHAEDARGAVEAAEARAEDLAAQVGALAHRLEAIQASPSWNLTRPIRVVTKRYRALKAGADG